MSWAVAPVLEISRQAAKARSRDEQPFEELCSPNETAVRDREPQVRDARLEIVLETGERARQDVAVVGANAGRQLARDRPRRRLIACGDPRL